MPDKSLTSEQVYFFHVFTDGIQRHQSDGLQFPSRKDAWHEATMSAGEIIREMDGRMHPGLDWRMDVTDSAGELIFRLSFKIEEL